jgi:hypothetical protein
MRVRPVEAVELVQDNETTAVGINLEHSPEINLAAVTRGSVKRAAGRNKPRERTRTAIAASETV